MRRWTKRLIACATLFVAAVPAWALSPFLVFFESGSARITPAAEAILENAVGGMRVLDVREIEIVGIADRVGSDADNVSLGRRRAEAVRRALLAKGMSPHIRVRIVSWGETRPIVETRDGVADAQNRAAIIVLTGMCVDWTSRDGRRSTEAECAAPLPR